MNRDAIPKSPAGTVAAVVTAWADAGTGKLLTCHGRAAAFVRDYRSREQDWPSIKEIRLQAGVGTGTAWRALSKVKAENVSND